MIPTDTIPEAILDWHEYYLSFLQEHRDPVEYKGRLLFEDGWRYSALDEAGPEWPPPEDKGELRGLKIAYQRIRRGVVRTMAHTLRTRLRAIEGLQSGKSLPLPMGYRLKPGIPGIVEFEINADGSPKRLDITAWQERLAALDRDAEDCDLRLEELGVGNAE